MERRVTPSPNVPFLLLSLCLPPCRFLQVRPACIEDERLLVGIVTFLNAYFKRVHAEFVPDEEDRDLRWILELLLNQVHILHHCNDAGPTLDLCFWWFLHKINTLLWFLNSDQTYLIFILRANHPLNPLQLKCFYLRFLTCCCGLFFKEN